MFDVNFISLFITGYHLLINIVHYQLIKWLKNHLRLVILKIPIKYISVPFKWPNFLSQITFFKGFLIMQIRCFYQIYIQNSFDTSNLSKNIWSCFWDFNCKKLPNQQCMFELFIQSAPGGQMLKWASAASALMNSNKKPWNEKKGTKTFEELLKSIWDHKNC